MSSRDSFDDEESKRRKRTLCILTGCELVPGAILRSLANLCACTVHASASPSDISSIATTPTKIMALQRLITRTYPVHGAAARACFSTRADRMLSQLQGAFDTKTVLLSDDSAQHKGRKGTESHFRIQIVSSKFQNLSLVKRHRLVQAAVEPEFAAGLHSLSIEAYDPKEWSSKVETELQKPPNCLGHGR